MPFDVKLDDHAVASGCAQHWLSPKQVGIDSDGAAEFPDDPRTCKFLNDIATRSFIPRSNWLFESVEQLVLHHGAVAKGVPLPRSFKPMPRRECFENANQLAAENAALTYVEGFAAFLSFATAHAWCVDQEGSIVDATWAGLGVERNYRYKGIAYDAEFLFEHQSSTGYFGVLPNQWRIDNRDLKAGYRFDDFGRAVGWNES